MDAAEEYYRAGKTGRSSIEQISWHYGAQAVVVSIDPRRVWVADPEACPHRTVHSARRGESCTSALSVYLMGLCSKASRQLSTSVSNKE